MRVSINSILTQKNQTVTIAGYVHSIRNQGKIAFLRVRDVTGSVQVVTGVWNKEVFESIKDLSVESVVQVEGLVKESKQVPEGVEIDAAKITIQSTALPLPIPVVTEKGAEEVDVTKRFDYRWLDLRKKESQKIFQVWTVLEQGIREYFSENSFTQLYSPALMSAPSESGAEVFEVKYFEGKAYLAQSPQFYKQMAIASGFEKVFMVGPVFRAELSFTTRHMTEFTGWDFEIAHITSHHDVMDTEEAMLKSGFAKLKSKGLIDEEISVPFARISLADAKAKLKRAGITSEKVGDLSPDEERGICKIVKEESGSEFVFITDYPKDHRAFYHMRDEETGLTKGFDLLYKGVEITTGAQREHRIEKLLAQATEKGLTEEGLSDYLSFFRYGVPPHGGVGIGPARIVAQILGLPSVKEATFLPRDVKRLRP
ncbi:MAG: aspartate--tRNA(Asn) ligase [bacterium]|nr:aspartate--tRNA(Asn) ligase [Candidatus Microgenomates bacterium CPR3]MCQ3944573.1 aspartate--tRNA(Asn) ligase [bacterium]RIK51766.1 MAG: aspartate--tRNA(Asn) ligase [Candidatus Microgenomates bacterium]